MEKIIFVNGTTLDYDAISANGNQLTISVNGGDFAVLENHFCDPANLEKLIQADENGEKMAVFKNYSILKEIRKRKNVVIDEIEETTADIIDVILEKEPEWKIEARKLAELNAMNTAGIVDLAAVVSDIATGAMTEGGAQ